MRSSFSWSGEPSGPPSPPLSPAPLRATGSLAVGVGQAGACPRIAFHQRPSRHRRCLWDGSDPRTLSCPCPPKPRPALGLPAAAHPPALPLACPKGPPGKPAPVHRAPGPGGPSQRAPGPRRPQLRGAAPPGPGAVLPGAGGAGAAGAAGGGGPAADPAAVAHGTLSRAAAPTPTPAFVTYLFINGLPLRPGRSPGTGCLGDRMEIKNLQRQRALLRWVEPRGDTG